MNILRENIQDNRFLRLIEETLKAGYCEEWTYHPTFSGSPQGGIPTPPTKLQTFFPRAGLCRMLVAPKHDMDLVLCHFNAFHQGANQLAFARPVRGRESVVDLDRTVL